MNSPRSLCFSLATAALLLLTGCTTMRPISDSGYDRDRNTYRGELNELEVLGVNPAKQVQEADIQAALKEGAKIPLKRGDTVVLVQSGAQFPDDGMMQELQSYYTLVPLSGVPQERPFYTRNQPATPTPPIDLTLRLAAARTGARTLIVYWGVFEISQENYATKSVSWVPIAGWMLPDESQQMRIRLKAALIDVETGRWQMLTPDAYTDTRSSGFLSRRHNDQKQVDALKTQAYKRLATEIVQRAT